MNSRGNIFKIIIEYEDTANKKIISKEDIILYLQANISAIRFYSFILHNCDNKRLHYHLVIATYKDYGQQTILNDIVKTLLCNKYCVSVMISRDLVHDVRYLTHKDEYMKYQYLDTDVTCSNLVDYDDIVYKQIDIYTLDFESLYNICEDCKLNKIAIYSQIGLINAKKYSFIIDEICSYIKKKHIGELNEKLYNTLEKEVKR